MYFWDSWQAVQEADSGGTVEKTWVYGEGIDEVVKGTIPEPSGVDTDGDSTSGESAVDVFFHHNSLGSVVAVTDVEGDVVESYRYAPYGAVTIRDHNSTVITSTRIEQPWGFTGRRADFEESSGLYYYRLRYYDPIAGRFVSRDPIGTWGDSGQRGNAQNYCGNNPVNLVDPMGLRSVPTVADVMAKLNQAEHERLLGEIRDLERRRDWGWLVGDMENPLALECQIDALSQLAWGYYKWWQFWEYYRVKVRYVMSIYVDQPGSGGERRVRVGSGGASDVGHAWVGVSKRVTTRGETTTVEDRQRGFYPAGGVGLRLGPPKRVARGVIHDDSKRQWEVKYEFGLSEADYRSALDRLRSYERRSGGLSLDSYHWESFNCVDWAAEFAGPYLKRSRGNRLPTHPRL